MLNFYVDLASGSDSAAGTPGSPWRTLEKASAHLDSLQPEEEVTVWLPECDVVVNQSIVWRYSNPDFMTHVRGPGSTVARLNGNGLANDLLKIMPTRRGEPSNLRFAGFRVSNSLNGIVVAGDRNDEANGWVGNVELRGIYVDRIGSKYASGEYGAGAFRMVNVRNSKIWKSQAHRLENNGSYGGHIHAAYLAHHSCGNLIEENRFTYCGGDPIRTRDRSNENIIRLNEFTRCGDTAIYSDWFCEGSTCTKPGGECPSWGNQFRDNSASNVGYSGSTVPLFAYFGADNHCGATPLPRLRTSGNTRF